MHASPALAFAKLKEALHVRYYDPLRGWRIK